MFKQKLTGAVLAAAMALTAAGLFADGISAVAQEQPNRAAEGNTEISLTSENSQLFLPTSYEQYLELQSPVDIAVCERYIAVAEEYSIYYFDRTAEGATYHIFTHSQPISKIQFATDGHLYFSDVLQMFYHLDFSDEPLTPSDELTNLSTFYIHNDTLFKVLMTNGATTYISTTLNTPKDVRNQFAQNTYSNTPLLTYDGGTFYSVVQHIASGDGHLHIVREFFSWGKYQQRFIRMCSKRVLIFFRKRRFFLQQRPLRLRSYNQERNPSL